MVKLNKQARATKLHKYLGIMFFTLFENISLIFSFLFDSQLKRSVIILWQIRHTLSLFWCKFTQIQTHRSKAFWSVPCLRLNVSNLYVFLLHFSDRFFL